MAPLLLLCYQHSQSKLTRIDVTALAWSLDGRLPLQRWHTPRLPMANPAAPLLRLRNACSCRHGRHYFYHSHVGFQAVSAAGPLIVDDIHVPYSYDEEKIIFIQDSFTKDFNTIEKGLMSSPLVWSGEAAAILVNGEGGGSANGTACNASLAVIDVEPGKTYRLRFIGATALTFTSLAIEGHENLEVIEADG